MMRAKGRYSAFFSIEFDYDSDAKGMKPFDIAREAVMGQAFTIELANYIRNALAEYGANKVVIVPKKTTFGVCNEV